MLSIASKPVRNHHCGTDELVIAYRCKICTHCFLYVTGNREGNCPYGGPFSGWEIDNAAEIEVSASDAAEKAAHE